jgi:PPOX class probable F420-dependent enzyme
MAVPIPDEFRDLLDKPVVATLATVLPNGRLQVHPVWADTENGYIRVNTARGRWKDKNLHARPRCTLLFMDPADPYRYLEVRGRVVAEREEGARQDIDRLAQKYLNVPDYPFYRGETRVTYLVEPTKITTRG